MAKETQSTQTSGAYGFENPFVNYSGFATEALREMWSWQYKTSQVLMDQSIRYSQNYADYVQNYFNETAKLTQEGIRLGTHMADEVRKSFAGLTEKITKSNH